MCLVIMVMLCNLQVYASPHVLMECATSLRNVVIAMKVGEDLHVMKVTSNNGIALVTWQKC